MKIEGKLTFIREDAKDLVNVIARSLAPDNVSQIRTFINEDSATITFSSDRIGTILSSIDDYLMNAIIAEKLSYLLKEDFIIKHEL
jgi:hypothetical protein